MGIRFAFRILLLSMLFACMNCGDWAADPPYYAYRYFGAAGPRGLLLDEAGDILVKSNGAYAVFEQPNGDGSVNVCRREIVGDEGGTLQLNHGIAWNNGFIYMSTSTAVYRWPYTPGSRQLVTIPKQEVVVGIPGPGHNTRTLIFDDQGRLYVSVGSNANVDPNSDRAHVKRFVIDGVGLPLNYNNNGEVFADGLRNEVGLDFDVAGVLWGVENGADNLNRPDLGGDIHNGNPAEEFNRFGGPPGTHYGYPYCFSTHNLQGVDAGTQFAWPSFMNDGVHTDEWCRNPGNNQPPVVAMPAHIAPLGVHFYKGQGCDTPGSFPCSAVSDAFVANHGSWNSDTRVGYNVVRYFFDKLSLMPTGQSEQVLYTNNVANCGNECHRPVNAVFNARGHLVISADSNHEVVIVYYGQPGPRFIEGCTGIYNETLI